MAANRQECVLSSHKADRNMISMMLRFRSGLVAMLVTALGVAACASEPANRMDKGNSAFAQGSVNGEAAYYENCAGCHNLVEEGRNDSAYLFTSGSTGGLLGTPERPIVGCEACHGAGSGHADECCTSEGCCQDEGHGALHGRTLARRRSSSVDRRDHEVSAQTRP